MNFAPTTSKFTLDFNFTENWTGRSLMITPRSLAKEGFMDIDREDYKDTSEDKYLKAVQISQLNIIEDRWTDDYQVRIYKA